MTTPDRIRSRLKALGFNVVIPTPPYVTQETRNEAAEELSAKLKQAEKAFYAHDVSNVTWDSQHPVKP